MANGLIYAAFAPPDAGAARTWLDALRQPALALRGYAVLMAQPAALRGAFDAWGYRPDGIEFMRQIKARWDPAGILNPGEFLL